jgi:putative transposase
VTWALRRAGEKINGKRVLRLLRERGWLCKTRHRRRRTTLPGDQSLVAPNLLQDRRASRPQEIWVSDLTYIRLPERFIYLATFLDVFTRRCVGWQISESLETQVVLDALQKAIEERHPPAGLILHSDRGCQYTSHAYQNLARSFQAQVSMSRKGNPYDNAHAESLCGNPQTRGSRSGEV